MAKVTSAPVFDENKNYEWKPEDEFVLSGDEFGFLFQTLKAEINGTNIGPKNKVSQYDILLSILKTAVEKGVAKEFVIGTETGNPPDQEAKAN